MLRIIFVQYISHPATEMISLPMPIYRRISCYTKRNSIILKDLFWSVRQQHLFSTKSYRDTVILPSTSFPSHVGGTKVFKHESDIREKAKFDSLYDWQWKNNTGELFILHDGPPYANGKTHVGHAINKILKDIINRYKALRGYRVHYVPGWDCHGLPIEMKVTSSDAKVSKLSSLDIRKKAQDFATDTIKLQKESFRQWGIMTNWENIYRTYDSHYVVEELRAFYHLYSQGIIYRGFKPVYWSPSSRTALAEAELEYNPQHKSPSIYVKLKLLHIPEEIKPFSGSKSVFALIWTTTPWTLPANQAVAYASSLDYSLVESSSTQELYVVGTDRISELSSILGVDLKILHTFNGSCLESATYECLFPSIGNKYELPFILGLHVTKEKGTGLVHTAPNHGFDDYNLFQHHKIPLDECLVNEDGQFNEIAGRDLAGKNIFTDGHETIISHLNSCILHTHSYVHSYPYDWRSKKPVIIRRTPQWFVNTDVLKEQCLMALDEVQVFPPSLKNDLKLKIENRPHWCISRQRSWGVPIPVFYQKQEVGECKPIITKETVEYLCSLIKNEGSDCWWTFPEEKLLPSELRQKCGLSSADKLIKGEDILDIWLDSGISWLVTLPEPKVADMYLEGVDQIRGWFQSSLTTSVALQNKAPYKCLYIHGFAVADSGKKMSKSLGNVVDPETLVKGRKGSPAYGVDVLRWWVALHASTHENVPVASHILQESVKDIQKIRSIIRFVLGNLNNFDYEQDGVLSVKNMQLLDQYILHQLYHFYNEVTEAYEKFLFYPVGKKFLNFFANDISAIYFSIIKDRLYCEAANSHERRSCLTALSFLLDVIVQLMAPILPHLAEEAYLHHPHPKHRESGAFRKGWFSCPNEWNQPKIEEIVKIGLQVKSAIFKQIGGIKPGRNDVCIYASPYLVSQLKNLKTEASSTNSELCELLEAASVTLLDKSSQVVENATSFSAVVNTSNGEEEVVISVHPSEKHCCPRCRKYNSDSVDTLCTRCQHVLENVI